MTSRWLSLKIAAVLTPHPHDLSRRAYGSDRSDRPPLRLKRSDTGSGGSLYYQHVVLRKRLERLERPDLRGNACARDITGSGGWCSLHALLGISGRSGRSGRDPPFAPLFSWAWRFHVSHFSSPSFLLSDRSSPKSFKRNQQVVEG